MNELKHTPGEWKFSPGAESNGHDLENCLGTIEFDGWHICAIWSNCHENGFTTEYEESTANAKLIAAAPTMLELLIDVEKAMRASIDLNNSGIHENVQSVIIKATL